MTQLVAFLNTNVDGGSKIMSINSMANAATARRPDTIPLEQVPKTLDAIAVASNASPAAKSELGQPDGNKGKTNNIETAFNVLFGYIPTEVITLYVAVLAAVGVEAKVTQTEWVVFWIFLLATSLVVWLVYGAKLKNLDIPLPLSYGCWPLWEMCAATLSFAAWSFALPQSPFTAYAWYSSALSGLVVLIASTILGLIAPFFQRRLAQ
jgi:hypothetical protein